MKRGQNKAWRPTQNTSERKTDVTTPKEAQGTEDGSEKELKQNTPLLPAKTEQVSVRDTQTAKPVTQTTTATGQAKPAQLTTKQATTPTQQTSKQANTPNQGRARITTAQTTEQRPRATTPQIDKILFETSPKPLQQLQQPTSNTQRERSKEQKQVKNVGGAKKPNKRSKQRTGGDQGTTSDSSAHPSTHGGVGESVRDEGEAGQKSVRDEGEAGQKKTQAKEAKEEEQAEIPQTAFEKAKEHKEAHDTSKLVERETEEVQKENVVLAAQAPCSIGTRQIPIQFGEHVVAVTVDETFTPPSVQANPGDVVELAVFGKEAKEQADTKKDTARESVVEARESVVEGSDKHPAEKEEHRSPEQAGETPLQLNEHQTGSEPHEHNNELVEAHNQHAHDHPDLKAQEHLAKNENAEVHDEQEGAKADEHDDEGAEHKEQHAKAQVHEHEEREALNVQEHDQVQEEDERKKDKERSPVHEDVLKKEIERSPSHEDVFPTLEQDNARTLAHEEAVQHEHKKEAERMREPMQPDVPLTPLFSQDDLEEPTYIPAFWAQLGQDEEERPDDADAPIGEGEKQADEDEQGGGSEHKGHKEETHSNLDDLSRRERRGGKSGRRKTENKGTGEGDEQPKENSGELAGESGEHGRENTEHEEDGEHKKHEEPTHSGSSGEPEERSDEQSGDLSGPYERTKEEVRRPPFISSLIVHDKEGGDKSDVNPHERDGHEGEHTFSEHVAGLPNRESGKPDDDDTGSDSESEDEWPELVPLRTDSAQVGRRKIEGTVQRKEGRGGIVGRASREPSTVVRRVGRALQTRVRGLQTKIQVCASTVADGVKNVVGQVRHARPRHKMMALVLYPFLYLVAPLLLLLVAVVTRGREWSERSKLQRVGLLPVVFFGAIAGAILWWTLSPLLYIFLCGSFAVSLVHPVQFLT